jgi:ABC-type Mn2+/Zn2+ transport system permease subunit
MQAVSLPYTVVAVAVALFVAGLSYALAKELMAYCFDPLLARTSGVQTTLIHYLLMGMMALTIVIGIRIVGSVLVTALLVLPAVTANMFTQRLRDVFLISLAVGLIGAWTGLWISEQFRMLPAGSCIVLVMVLEFLIGMLYSKLRG